MNKSTKKSIRISELISLLEKAKEEEGDVEVLTINEAEECFDGISHQVVSIKAVEGQETFVCLYRSEVVIKPRGKMVVKEE